MGTRKKTFVRRKLEFMLAQGKRAHDMGPKSMHAIAAEHGVTWATVLYWRYQYRISADLLQKPKRKPQVLQTVVEPHPMHSAINAIVGRKS